MPLPFKEAYFFRLPKVASQKDEVFYLMHTYLYMYVYLRHKTNQDYLLSLFQNNVITYAGEFTKRVREMSSQLFVTLYTLSIYPFAHKQLRRHLPNPFREFRGKYILWKLKVVYRVKQNYLSGSYPL